MMQIDRDIIIGLLTEKSHDDIPMITVFRDKPIGDMTDEELTDVIYSVVGDYWLWRKLRSPLPFERKT